MQKKRSEVSRNEFSLSVEWYTPENILAAVRAYYQGPIPLDPANSKNNHTRATYSYTEEIDGLRQSWKIESNPGVFVNPPYGKVFPDWCRKIKEEAHLYKVPIIALLPCGARYSTRYWQDSIFIRELNSMCFLNKRVKFLRPDGRVGKQNVYDSQICGFNVNSSLFMKCFAGLGACLEVAVFKSGDDFKRIGDIRVA